MAIINCPECNAQVSDKATKCPQCGHPIKEHWYVESLKISYIMILVIIVIVIVAYIIWGGKSFSVSLQPNLDFYIESI